MAGENEDWNCSSVSRNWAGVSLVEQELQACEAMAGLTCRLAWRPRCRLMLASMQFRCLTLAGAGCSSLGMGWHGGKTTQGALSLPAVTTEIVTALRRLPGAIGGCPGMG